MRISLLCSDEHHPINSHLKRWIESHRNSHQIELVRCKRQLSGGDVLFLVSCSEIINEAERAAYRASLVLHASALPEGRGWSPHIWQIIAGATELTVSLLEAEDKVDSGRIWRQLKVFIPSDALWDEINKQLFEAEIELMDFAVHNISLIKPRVQETHIQPTYFPRRSPEDSQIDPDQSIASQFDKIRVCDPSRYPAFFDLRGYRYKVTLEKLRD